MKHCPDCGKKLAFEKFSKNKRRKDGRNTYCKICQSNRMKIYRSQPSVKEKKRQYEREYIHRPNVKQHRQVYALNYYYGLTPQQREALWLKQEKKCAICKKTLIEWRKSRVDHDHDTKKVRGILCNDCNLLLGHAKDNVVILQAAIVYLSS